jgi:hypothetical protein
VVLHAIRAEASLEEIDNAAMFKLARLNLKQIICESKQTYAEGIIHQGARVLDNERAKLPNEVAQQILAQPNDYPVGVWQHAEYVATANARMAVRPVGRVAKMERWFAD